MCVIKNELSFKNYKDTLDNKEQVERKMNFIKSTKHNVNTIQMNKVVLSSYSNKRYVLEDGITSYAYGHFRTK